MEKQGSKPHDRFVKSLLSHHGAAVEFLRHALPQKVIDLLDMQQLQYTDASYTTEELKEYMSDIVLRVPFQNSLSEAEVTILIEHKSYRDRMTSIQMLSYLAEGYRQQIKNGKKQNVIIPVVYYHGKQKWQIPSLTDYFKDVPTAVLQYIPQFSMEMLSIRDMPPEQIYAITNAMLRAAFMVQKGAHKRIYALEEYARVFNTLSAEKEGNFFISMMVYIFETGALEKSEVVRITKKLDDDMKTKTMTIKEQLIAEGMEKGMERGIEKGMAKGIEKGSLQSRYEVAKRLKLRNIPIDEICALTDLTVEEVTSIKV